MSKVLVVYWSGTGNTEAMANAVAKGVQDAGAEVIMKSVSDADSSEIKDYDLIALGCPSMGAEVLEEDEMEPFVSEIEGLVSGKKIALFGSYGWGDGEWMRDWEERMKSAGAFLINDAGFICNDAPDESAVAECEDLGTMLAKS